MSQSDLEVQEIDSVAPIHSVCGVNLLKVGEAIVLFGVLTGATSLPAGSSSGESAPAALDLDSFTQATPAQIEAFFKSPVYTTRHRADAEFIKEAYQGILLRDPDPKGFNDWLAALKNSQDNSKAREHLVQAFLASKEYSETRTKPGAARVGNRDTARNAGNRVFNLTGVFVNDATAFPISLYESRLKLGKVAWIALQIDNGGKVREDNASAVEHGWASQWRAAGFKVGFWGCARGIGQHGKQPAYDEAVPIVKADAALAVKLAAKYRADFYIADCEDSYQAYKPDDPAPGLNRVYVEAFKRESAAAGIADIPRALSSMGRVALDMKPWIDEGWDAMPQAYWNAYAVYQPSLCVDFYMQAGWPIDRIHPTIGTFTSEGEKRVVSLQEYDKDLRTRATTGFSFYLPESYLRTNDSAYRDLAEMSAR
jgi:hypothetical protein